jgi:hypothetical protein
VVLTLVNYAEMKTIRLPVGFALSEFGASIVSAAVLQFG